MCDCTTYECLEVVQDYSECPEVVTIKLEATATETLKWQYEFNGSWKGGTLDVTQGENIVLPWVFNESYVHEIKFYSDDVLLNDTCYKLDTSKISGTYNTPTSSASTFLTFEVTSGMLSTNDDGEQVLTNSDIASRTAAILVDGNQSYNGFTQSGNAITMTNGVTFYVGQKITILF